MKYKAVVFDLFETLITEWGHKKYTKNEMCADLEIERKQFDLYWEQQEEERYLGKLSFEDSILDTCKKCGKSIDNSTLSNIIDKRRKTKAACFDFVKPDVFQMLDEIKSMGLPIVLISNCSFEEVVELRESAISKYFEEVILSCEVHMKKPDACIYEEAARRMGIAPVECVFVGDGGSNELLGAQKVGMKAIQAKWYTNELPQKRANIDGFLVADEPEKVIEFLLT